MWRTFRSDCLWLNCDREAAWIILYPAANMRVKITSLQVYAGQSDSVGERTCQGGQKTKIATWLTAGALCERTLRSVWCPGNLRRSLFLSGWYKEKQLCTLAEDSHFNFTELSSITVPPHSKMLPWVFGIFVQIKHDQTILWHLVLPCGCQALWRL